MIALILWKVLPCINIVTDITITINRLQNNFDFSNTCSLQRLTYDELQGKTELDNPKET